MTVDLGVFTAAELRAGGINSRGFLQPLLPPPPGVDPGPENRAAAEGLASRGLLRHGQPGWWAVGRYKEVLEAAAVARSLVAIWPADPAATLSQPARLALGRLGITGWVLDLCPESPGYRARMCEVPVAAAELAGYVDVLAKGAPGLPGRGPGGAGRAGPAGSTLACSISDLDPGWGAVVEELKRGVATVRIEAASINQPSGPLLQHRLTLVSTDDGGWLLIGTREGGRATRQVVPSAHLRLGPLLEALLSGSSPVR